MFLGTIIIKYKKLELKTFIFPLLKVPSLKKLDGVGPVDNRELPRLL